MKKGFFTTFSVAALVAGGPTVLSAETGETAEVPPASAFNPIQRYAITYDDTRDVAEFYLRDFGIKPRDATFQQVDHPSDRSMRVVLVTVDGIQDDSVRGIQWRFGMKTSAGSWEAVEAGMRRMCHRGENAGKWQKGVCP